MLDAADASGSVLSISGVGLFYLYTVLQTLVSRDLGDICKVAGFHLLNNFCFQKIVGPNKASLQHKYRQLLVSLGGHDKGHSVCRQLVSLWIDVVLLNMQDTRNVAGFHTSSANVVVFVDRHSCASVHTLNVALKHVQLCREWLNAANTGSRRIMLQIQRH